MLNQLDQHLTADESKIVLRNEIMRHVRNIISVEVRVKRNNSARMAMPYTTHLKMREAALNKTVTRKGQEITTLIGMRDALLLEVAEHIGGRTAELVELRFGDFTPATDGNLPTVTSRRNKGRQQGETHTRPFHNHSTIWSWVGSRRSPLIL